MSGSRLYAASILFLSLTAASAQAAVIFDNGVTSNTGRVSDASYSGGTGVYSADNFVLAPGSNMITDVHWRGRYTRDAPPCCPPPTLDDFTIQIYADVGGLPALNPLVSFHVGNNVSRTPAGTVGNVAAFSYSADISPYFVVAGTTYWLSIFDVSTESNYFIWAAQLLNPITLGHAAARVGAAAPWTPEILEHEFQLTGGFGPGIPIPEPVTLVLFGLALAGLGFSRRRKLH